MLSSRRGELINTIDDKASKKSIDATGAVMM